MASADEVAELRAKVGALARRRFGSGPDAAQRLFRAYDANRDGEARPAEIERLLRDAGVGNDFTRASWVSGILEELDRDRSGGIRYAELARALGLPSQPAKPKPAPSSPSSSTSTTSPRSSAPVPYGPPPPPPPSTSSTSTKKTAPRPAASSVPSAAPARQLGPVLLIAAGALLVLLVLNEVT